MEVPYGFNLHFPNDIRYLFLCPLPFHTPSLMKCVFRSSAFFLWWCLFSYYRVFEFITCSEHASYTRCLPCRYVRPVCSLSFDSLNYGFQRADVLNFHEVFVSVWSFMDCAFSVSLRSLCLIYGGKDSPLYFLLAAF